MTGAAVVRSPASDEENTPERVLGLTRSLGITRIADVTGLDRIGIPVAQAVQPFSLSLAVSQGKGFTPAQAIISAVMECAETFFAERVSRFQTIRGAAKDLGVEPHRFDAFARTRRWASQPAEWLECEEMLNGATGLVPFDLVHTAYLAPTAARPSLFAGTTTGVAAGFDETAATRHALLECIERDALARAHRTHGFLHHRRIDPASVCRPELRNLVDRLVADGFLVGLWHMPSPTGVPAIWCHLMENQISETAILPYPAEGSAARADAEAAAVAAILEAVQSRLAAICGTREDLTRAHYPRYPDRDGIAAHRRLLAQGPCPIGFDAITSPVGSDADLPPLLDRLSECGAGPVYRFRVDTAPLPDISVVRLVVPFLEPFFEH